MPQVLDDFIGKQLNLTGSCRMIEITLLIIRHWEGCISSLSEAPRLNGLANENKEL